MKRRRMIAAIGAVAVLGLCTSQASADTGAITEYWLGPRADAPLAPAGIGVGPDGLVWFTTTSGRIGRITPGGQVSTFPAASPDDEMGDVTTGADGNLWFTEWQSDRIGRATPEGQVKTFRLPAEGSHPFSIAAGPDGNVWFTENGNQRIGRITPTGALTEFPVPTLGHGALEITAGPDGNMWFSETPGNAIARITLAGDVTEFPLPAGTTPTDIAAGPDGALWFADYPGGVGRMTTTGDVTTFAVPGEGVAGIVWGADGNLWIDEAGSDSHVVRMTPAGDMTRFDMAIPSRDLGRGVAAADGNVWFMEQTNGRVAKVEVAPKTVPDLTLRTSAASVVYPGTVTITAHLSAHGSNAVVSLYRQPVGQPAVLAFSGPVNASGNVTFVARPSRTTKYVAKYAGADTDAPVSSLATVVPVRARITAKQSGYYGTSGVYRLYHYNATCVSSGRGCPTYTATVAPSHSGFRVTFTLQRHTSKGWVTAGTARVALGKSSRATVIEHYTGTGIRGLLFREHASFPGDADHAANVTAWAYFRVT